jgi:hypothetical protein
MTRGRQLALRFRRLILVLGILFVVFGLSWLLGPFFGEVLYDDFVAAGLMGTPLAPGGLKMQSEGGHAVNLALVLGLLLLAQWAFLRPGRLLTTRLAVRGWPLRSAIIAAAAMAMLLTIGAIALVLEIPDWWEPVGYSYNGWIIAEIWTAMLLLWMLWAWIFFLAGTVLLWAFGPGIVLLYMHEKYRRARLFPLCSNCGYNLRGNESGVCPECGTAVDPNVT